MNNKIFINEHDIIEIHVVGDQNEHTVKLMGKEIKHLLANLSKEAKPILLLDDLSAMKKVTPAGRAMVVSLGREVAYEKLALVGSAGLLRLGVNLLFQAIGKGSRLRYFVDRNKAIVWLKQP